MSKYLSQKELDKIYRKEKRSLGVVRVKDKIRDANPTLDKRLPKGKVFFSHSHLDKTIVGKIGLLFSKLEIEIYVDWLDKSLPESTNAVTAASIKNKIKDCDKFLFLATYHGLRSKWCNWELGIADAMKGNDNLAILPIETKSGKWKGNEYLHLYSEMRINANDLDNIKSSQVIVHGVNGKEVSLRSWLSN
ncbi:toll/interleukin-1 receptor domain-containing protein [Flagellimonas sp. HMM57]|uniref:toll/interleukin-1 receptor domain-containing protein n=1 Tax=unclassified Flagellimonas TaxID=2644544 RepID=UPI0013D44F08|nr:MULTISPECIES: toll/interleukin-1 receptor domain-containing protein [unclassified Flagellimonas]UII77185.1 toll/interleukin-1 receptor domain-containing protein [Flagellimonas sp. HMM57]